MGEIERHEEVYGRERGPTGINSKNLPFMTAYFENACNFGIDYQIAPCYYTGLF